METVIQSTDVTKLYGNVVGVSDLNLEVRRGEIFGFLGPNAAGKTTFVRLLLGLIKPTAGRMKVLGMDAAADSHRVRSRLGYVPEDLALYEDLTAGDYLRYLYRLRGCSGDVVTHEFVKSFGVDLKRKIKGCSKGTKQRIGIVQALLHNPEVLILDEASSSLDPLMRDEFYRVLLREKESGKTIFMASHNLPEVERVCDRVALIRDGRISMIETVDRLKQRKLRKMKIVFVNAVEAERFVSASGIPAECGGETVEFTVGTDVNDVIRIVSGYQIVDLLCGEATLEEVFIEHYMREGNGGVSRQSNHN